MVNRYGSTSAQNNPEQVSGDKAITAGKHTVRLDFTYDGKKNEVGKGGTYALGVDGKKVGEATIDRTVPYLYSIDETLDVGEDRGTPILEDYASKMPFKFNGKTGSVAIELK